MFLHGFESIWLPASLCGKTVRGRSGSRFGLARPVLSFRLRIGGAGNQPQSRPDRVLMLMMWKGNEPMTRGLGA